MHEERVEIRHDGVKPDSTRSDSTKTDSTRSDGTIAKSSPRKIKISGDTLDVVDRNRKPRSRVRSLNLSDASPSVSPQNSGDRDRVLQWIIDLETMPPVLIRSYTDELIEELQKYSVEVFISTESAELSKLGDDFVRLQIVGELIYIPGDGPVTLNDKIDCFLGLMKEYHKTACIRGVNFITLACFLAAPLLRYSVKHKLKIADEIVLMQDILDNRLVCKLSTGIIVNHIMGLILQYGELASREEITIVDGYCRQAIANYCAEK